MIFPIPENLGGGNAADKAPHEKNAQNDESLERWAAAYDRAVYSSRKIHNIPGPAASRYVTRYCRLLSDDTDDFGQPFVSCSVFVYTLDRADRTVTDSLFIHDLTHSPAILERFLRAVKRERLTCSEVLEYARLLADAELL